MGKKICVFTQTYGNDRHELFQYHNFDSSDIEFRNNFDLNLYSFHNSDKNYMNEILENDYFKQIKNLEIITYENINYTESWRRTIKKLSELSIDYVIFLQDDCFSINTKKNIKDLVKFIKNEDFDLLSIERDSGSFNLKYKKIIYSNNLNVYNTTSEDFSCVGYSFDDGPFVGKLSFLIDKIYDENYYRYSSIWSAELYLHNKISKTPVQRYVTNKPSHRRYYIVGRNCSLREFELERLKTFLQI